MECLEDDPLRVEALPPQLFLDRGSAPPRLHIYGVVYSSLFKTQFVDLPPNHQEGLARMSED